MFTRFLLVLIWPGLLWSGVGTSDYFGRSAAEPIIVRRALMATDRNVSYVPGAPELTTPAATPTTEAPPTPAATPPPTPAAIPPPTPTATPPPTPATTPPPAVTPPTQEPTPPSTKTRTVTAKLRDLPKPSDHSDDFAFRLPSRYKPDAMREFIESIKRTYPVHGFYEKPQIVRGRDGKWVIVCGHRRIAALYALAEKGEPGFSLDMDVRLCGTLGQFHGCSDGSEPFHQRAWPSP